jgi:molecular chaperone DnaK (HSP70)
MNVYIWEGERPVAKDNYFLGEMYLKGLTPAPKGEVKFEITFEIDADGILKVTAVETKTNQKVETTINTRTLPQATVEKLIQEAQANSKQDAMMKTILDVQISFEYFCDVLKKRCNDERLSFP